MKKTILVMTGGGAKAIIHLGVFDVLKENGMRIDHIVSTSSGSLTAVLASSGLSFDKINKEMLRYKQRVSWFLPSIKEFGYFSQMPFRSLLSTLVKEKKLEELPIPVTIVASNITKLKDHIITKGSISDAVCMASAYPPIYKPKELKGDYIIDGGVLNSEPANVARKISKGAIVITVSLTSPFDKSQFIPDSRLETIYRCLFYHSEMSRRANADNYSDIVIYPLKHLYYGLKTWKGIFEFYKAKKIQGYYNLGRKEALGNLGKVGKLIRQKNK
jgi:NTE family protein